MSKIGIFDSGIGGLTILKEIQKKCKEEDYYYYADGIHNPYGEKSEKELNKIVDNIVEYLLKKDVKIIVIACNTATTKCMKHLRKKYPEMTFIGTVPAIKVACDKGYKNILVMATTGTHELVKDNKRSNQTIYLQECKGLANAIERNDRKTQKEILEKIKEEYKNIEIDAIVLGCTHYPMIKRRIHSYFKDAVLLDGSKGVAKEVKRKLKEKKKLEKNTGTIIYYDSKTKKEKKKKS